MGAFTFKFVQADGTPAEPPTLDDTKAVLEFLESAVRFTVRAGKEPVKGYESPTAGPRRVGQFVKRPRPGLRAPSTVGSA